MRRFFIPALLLLLFLGMEATFLSLAHWQYSRSLQAQALMDVPQPTFTVSGNWVNPSATIVLDNQPSPENPSLSGWRLLSLYQPDETRALFVDRGWLPFPPNRETADNLPCTPDESTPTNLTVILKKYPERTGWLQGPITTTDSRIYAFLAPQGAFPEANQAEYLVTTTPTCAATRASLPPLRSPQRHQSYMLQWLGLALVTPLLFSSLWWSKLRKRK